VVATVTALPVSVTVLYRVVSSVSSDRILSPQMSHLSAADAGFHSARYLPAGHLDVVPVPPFAMVVKWPGGVTAFRHTQGQTDNIQGQQSTAWSGNNQFFSLLTVNALCALHRACETDTISMCVSGGRSCFYSRHLSTVEAPSPTVHV
jgi:hypothetical protein